MSGLSEQVNRKFTDIVDLDDEWEIQTDTGWEPLVDIKETVEYDVWRLELDNGLYLECADNHIVFLENFKEVFVKDLKIGNNVQTEIGHRKVSSVSKKNRSEKMYDVEVGSFNHRFYSNGILSHNTTVAAGYLLWYAMFVPDSEILVASNKGKNAADIMRRIRYAYENCPDHIRAGVTEYNKGTISFDNGSRIVAETTTETSGRGMSISLVYLDEFAFVRNTIATEFWTSLSPTLSTGGKCIITSTPNNDDDQFANLWRGANDTFDQFGNDTGTGKNGFKGYMAKWDQHPERDEAWAEQERNSIGIERFRREHDCEFIIYSETLVDALKLVDMQGVDPIRHMGQVRWYKHPHPNCTYVVGLDPSLGTGGNPAAIQVIELPSMIQVAEWQHNKTPIEGQIKTLMGILQHLAEMKVKDIYWSVENNTIGEAALVVIRDTGEENFPGEFIHEPKKVPGHRGRKGFHTGHKSKLEACAQLKRYIEADKLTIYSKSFLKELKNFIARGTSYSAQQGETDDLVMAMILCIRMITYIAMYEESVYDAINSNLANNLMDEYIDEWDQPLPSIF